MNTIPIRCWGHCPLIRAHGPAMGFYLDEQVGDDVFVRGGPENLSPKSSGFRNLSEKNAWEITVCFSTASAKTAMLRERIFPSRIMVMSQNFSYHTDAGFHKKNSLEVNASADWKFYLISVSFSFHSEKIVSCDLLTGRTSEINGTAIYENIREQKFWLNLTSVRATRDSSIFQFVLLREFKSICLSDTQYLSWVDVKGTE